MFVVFVNLIIIIYIFLKILYFIVDYYYVIIDILRKEKKWYGWKVFNFLIVYWR